MDIFFLKWKEAKIMAKMRVPSYPELLASRPSHPSAQPRPPAPVIRALTAPTHPIVTFITIGAGSPEVPLRAAGATNDDLEVSPHLVTSQEPHRPTPLLASARACATQLLCRTGAPRAARRTTGPRLAP